MATFEQALAEQSRLINLKATSHEDAYYIIGVAGENDFRIFQVDGHSVSLGKSGWMEDWTIEDDQEDAS